MAVRICNLYCGMSRIGKRPPFCHEPHMRLFTGLLLQDNYSEMERALEASILAVEILNEARQTLDAIPEEAHL